MSRSAILQRKPPGGWFIRVVPFLIPYRTDRKFHRTCQPDVDPRLMNPSLSIGGGFWPLQKWSDSTLIPTPLALINWG